MKDRMKGKGEQIEGEVKEEVGKVLGDRSTEMGGTVEQVKGKAREKIGEVKQDLDRLDHVEVEDDVDKP